MIIFVNTPYNPRYQYPHLVRVPDTKNTVTIRVNTPYNTITPIIHDYFRQYTL